jgi:transposase
LAPHKKNAARLGAHLVFLDESGFLLIPPARKTWAPRGLTPLLRHRYRRERISVISALSLSPQRRRLGLYWGLHPKNIQQAEVAGFLRLLLRHLRGHVVLLWDGARPHRGKRIRELCRRLRRLHLERFPAYAPELNPDEGVWAHLKRTLSNGRPDALDALNEALLGALQKLHASPRLLRGCLRQSKLPIL